MTPYDEPLRLGSRILYRSDLLSCSLGNNESFTVHLKNGGKIRLIKGEPGHDWVMSTYRDAWRRAAITYSEK
jgi:hypothetical protein